MVRGGGGIHVVGLHSSGGSRDWLVREREATREHRELQSVAIF